MIDTGVITWSAVCFVICFLLPLLGWLIMLGFRQRVAISFLAGALAFAAAQLLIRIPIVTYILPNMAWFLRLQYDPIGYGLFLGLTAALFEVFGTYLFMRLMMKKHHRIADGVAFGMGVSCVEATVLVGFTYLTICIGGLMLNGSGSLGALERIPGLYGLVAGASESAAAMAALERMSAMLLHIGLSVLILMGIRKHKPVLYLAFAIAIHTVVDAASVILTSNGTDAFVVQLILLIAGIGMAAYAFLCMAGEKTRG